MNPGCAVMKHETTCPGNNDDRRHDIDDKDGEARAIRTGAITAILEI